MSTNPLNDISKVYLEQVATQEVGLDEGMTLKDFKKQRSRQKQKEKRAADKIAPGRRAGIHADKASPERAARHRANVDPDFEGDDERNYPGGKLRAKKVRKAKAMGELGESSHLETDMKKRREANEKAVKDMKNTDAYKSMAATAAKKFDEEFVDPEHGEAPSGRSPLQNVSDHPKASVRKKAVKAFRTQMGKEYGGNWKSRSNDPVKEALDPVGKEDADVDNDGKKGTNADKYLMKRRKAIGKVISTQEAKEVKRWWDDDGDEKGYEEGEVSGKFKKKKSVKEGFSNWRQDLVEIISNSDSEDTKKIKEKKVTNKVTINPNLKESVEGLGGTLLEMVEVQDFDSIFDDLTESEIFLLSDNLIEEVVEEFFNECLEEGYDLSDVENVLNESIELSSALLNEAKVTLGHDTKIKSDRLQKVKSAVKKVGKAAARGAGYVAGAAVRGAKAVGREFKSGYQRGRGGSSGSSTSSSTSSSSSGSSSSETGTKRPGLLGRIGSALKSGLKRTVAKGARAVSRGARNVARKMEGGDKKPHTAARKPSTYRGAGAGRTERVSSGSYQAPTKKKAEKPADPWKGSSSVPQKPKPKPKAEKPADPWEGSASTPPKTKAKTKKAAAPKATAPKAKATAAPKRKRKSKLDDLLASVRADESVNLGEKVLTAAETKEKERIVKSMKVKAADFEKRYPGRGKEVMYATATKMAKKMAEQALEIQPKTQPVKQEDPRAKQIQQRDVQTKKRLLQQKMTALQRGATDIDV